MGTWIEIRQSTESRHAHTGRSLRGNVDRNNSYIATYGDIKVVPYVGTWIEMRKTGKLTIVLSVVPYVGTWIEIHAIHTVLKR